jgi:glycosyltransferase involved in cell wall biosynthesis
MRLYFDCRFIRVDHHDGVSRFSSELFSAIARKTAVTALISHVDQLTVLPPGVNHILINDPTNPWLELWLPRKLNKHGAGIVFSPMQTMGSLGKKYKLILTLHDLIYYEHRKPPGSLAWPIRLAWRLFHLSYTPVKKLLDRADAVVTISQTTKSLIEAKQLTSRAVHVLYNASSMSSVGFAKIKPRSKNLVYMGSFMPYKNVETLIGAMEQLPEFTLTLCSKVEPKRKRQLLRGLSAETISRIQFANGVSEPEYLDLLDESYSLVSASKDEGFGIPIIEAMSRSVPVIVSNIPIFREICGGAGTFFNPESSDEFVNAVKRLEPDSSWELASQKSLERSRAFSWDDSAAKLLFLVETLRR